MKASSTVDRGNVRCPLLQVLQLVRGGASSLALMLSGPAFSRCPGKGWAQLCTALRHQHGRGWQPRPGISLVVNPDMAFCSSAAKNFTMALGASTALHIRLFLTTLESPVLPLFIASTSFWFLFLLYFPTTYLLPIVATEGLRLGVWYFPLYCHQHL